MLAQESGGPFHCHGRSPNGVRHWIDVRKHIAMERGPSARRPRASSRETTASTVGPVGMGYLDGGQPCLCFFGSSRLVTRPPWVVALGGKYEISWRRRRSSAVGRQYSILETMRSAAITRKKRLSAARAEAKATAVSSPFATPRDGAAACTSQENVL